jgi:hemoglobin
MTEIAEEITEDTLAAVIEAFYRKVRRDPDLAPVFEAAIPDEAWPIHLEIIRGFWSSVLLKTGRYKGNPLRAHLGKGIRPEHFERWLALFDATAAEVLSPAAAAILTDKARQIAASLQAGLYFRPEPVRPPQPPQQ